MEKMNKVKGFVKNHKKEIAIAAVAGTVGAVGGFIGCKRSFLKEYGDLIKVVSDFGNDANSGKSFKQSLTNFLFDTTGNVHPIIPINGVTKTIGDTFSEELVDTLVTYHGFDPGTKISGVMVGTLRD